MSGQFQDTEDFIFDLNSGDDIDAGNQLPAVREPGRQLERQPEPAPRVPASDPAPTARDVVVSDDEDDLGLVSDAINALMRPGGRPRDDVQVRTPVASTQAPGLPTATGRVGQGTQVTEQQRTPAEQAIIAELREERRKRQDLERRLDSLARPQQPQQPAAPQQDFDTRFFSEPQVVLNELAQSFASQLASVRLETDLELTEMRHGAETFKTAFEAYMEQVSDGKNFPLYQRVMTSQSPGEAIMAWHRENQIVQETGGDLSGFKERLRQEILAELQANGGRPAPAQPQADVPRRENGQFAPRHEVRLPTATSRLTGSPISGNEDVEDGSDDAIFDAGRARTPRR